MVNTLKKKLFPQSCNKFKFTLSMDDFAFTKEIPAQCEHAQCSMRTCVHDIRFVSLRQN